MYMSLKKTAFMHMRDHMISNDVIIRQEKIKIR